ncbi:MAG TPA: dihydroxyacetone kinase, partial [Dehalococcoidia bacterium]|nr:dihydroxyacetone kinase [Dehalococcoidia bacterium]
QIDIQNMSQQNKDFASGQAQAATSGGLAVIAVSCGDGLDSLFREVGCAVVVSGGQTMNPSVRDILEAVESAGGDDTIILPNNKNVVAAAKQAAEAKMGIHVVPSNTMPQGVAAMLAFNPEESVENNLESMTAAIADIVTIEVTKAVRSTTSGNVKVATGQYISLLEGEIVLAGDTAEQVLESALSQSGLSSGHIVTLYLGEDADLEGAKGVSQRLQLEYPGIQVDLIEGGQPHYHYLASVE